MSKEKMPESFCNKWEEALKEGQRYQQMGVANAMEKLKLHRRAAKANKAAK